MKLNKSYKKVELLAPAKDKETALAAINSGADAVYIGASMFGARQNASNPLEDIKDIVEFAHFYNVRVHVTLNTILTDEELEKSVELINELYKIGVDAIIVQDMGIFDLAIRQKLPPIEIHASTQCDNRTLEKVKFFQQMGVKRVILARELTLAQIEAICSEVKKSDYNSEMEIETFIHGALCVSYSGQCYLSASIGGRSANRGKCAQACRKKYTLVNEAGKILAKDKYLLSLRDFNASKHIERLINAGVKSFKIEGRLKDVNYVKNVVAFYRKEIDKYADKTSSGKVFSDFEPDVKKSFNRGFTDYFLSASGKNSDIPRKDRSKNLCNFDSPKSLGEKLGKVGKVDKNSFVLNGVELNPQDGLCYFADGELFGCLVNKVEGSRIFPNNIGKITSGTLIYRNFDSKFNKALQNSKTKRKIAVKFTLQNKNLIVVDEDGISVITQLPSGEIPKNCEKMLETFKNQISKTGDSKFFVTNVETLSLPDFMPVSVINDIRRRSLEELALKRLKTYTQPAQTRLRYAEFPLKTYDYRANVFNQTAKTFYQNCNCEVCEFALEKTHDFEGKELMRTKHCLKFEFDLCKSSEKLFLIDEKGKKYKLNFDCSNCEMIIIN